MNIDPETCNKVSANRIQYYVKRIVHYDLNGIYSEDTRIIQHLQISVIHHITKWRNQIISINEEKVFDKIQYTFMIKTLNKLGTEETNLFIIKTTYDKHTVNITLYEKAGSFSSKIRNKIRRPLLPLLFNIVLEVLVKAIKQKIAIKASKLERSKLCLYMCIMYYIEKTLKTPPKIS